jgi:hypothetical protein
MCNLPIIAVVLLWFCCGFAVVLQEGEHPALAF